MKRVMSYLAISAALFCASACYAGESEGRARVLLLIAEQNIGGPQRAWWASEVDLSLTETAIADELHKAGIAVVRPDAVADALTEKKAFRLMTLNTSDMRALAEAGDAQYILNGQALVSGGERVPQSGMRSFYATVTARLIRVADGVQVESFDVSGRSAHVEAIAGGSEALKMAARRLAQEVTQALSAPQAAKQGVDTSCHE